MSCHTEPPVALRPGRPALEVADIFRAHGETFRQSHTLSVDQLKVMRAIERCRTEFLGGHVDVCTKCGFEKPAYNSCRNRHCPKCQSLAQARWIEQRLERILPTNYFHIVFTLPSALRTLARANRRLVFDLLFASGSRTLLDLGDDSERMGGRLGITAVLHTWTRELTFHPHLHCIVTGGGLSPRGDAWIGCNRRYIFPVKVLGSLFRGKFLDGLGCLRERGLLKYTGAAESLADAGAFKKMLDRLYDTNWVVYAKRPFAGPEHVFRYLGRYTHRVGLSNQRLQAFDEHGVRFATKGGKNLTLAPAEFIRRFLDHVLPSGFTKIRHFGLHAAGNVHTKLDCARRLMLAESNTPSSQLPLAVNSDTTADQSTTELPADDSWQQLMLKLTGVDFSRCPSCRHALIRRTLPPHPPAARDTS